MEHHHSGKYYRQEEEEGMRSRHYSGSSYSPERRPPRDSPVYEDRRSDSRDFNSSGDDDYSSPKKSKHKRSKKKAHYDDDDSDSRHYYSNSSRSSSRSSYHKGSRPRYQSSSPGGKRMSSSMTPPPKKASKQGNKSFEKSYSSDGQDKFYSKDPQDSYPSSYKQPPNSFKKEYSDDRYTPPPQSKDYKKSGRHFTPKDFSPGKAKSSGGKRHPREYSPDSSSSPPKQSRYDKDFLPDSAPKRRYNKEEDYSPDRSSKSSDDKQHFEHSTRPRHYSPKRHYDSPPDHPRAYENPYKGGKQFHGPSTSHYKPPHYNKGALHYKKEGRYPPGYENYLAKEGKHLYPGYSPKEKYYPDKYRAYHDSAPPHPRARKRSYSPDSEESYPRKPHLGNLKPNVNPSTTRQVVFLDIQAYPMFLTDLQGRLLPKGTFVCLFHGLVRGPVVLQGCPAVEALQRAGCFFRHPDCNTPQGLALETLPPVALLLHSKLPLSIPFFILSKMTFYKAVGFIKQSREVHFISMDHNALPRLLDYLHS